MNFEQNFNPLEPGSEEYNSLDIAPLSEPLLGDTLPELQTVTRRLASREVPLPKRIGGEIKFEPSVTDDARSTYNVVKSEKDYFDKLVTSKRDSFSPDSAEYNAIKGYISEANKFNQPNSKERVDLVYNLGKDFLDIDKDDATRNSFIRSHYAPLYFSTSKVLKGEYDTSPLNSELSPRQYTGLNSLKYGKESEYNNILSVLSSSDSSDIDKQIAKYNLDKIGAYIDIDAASKMVNDSGYEVKTEAGVVRNQDKKAKDMAKTGMDLYNASVQSLPLIDDMIRDVEYQNPYNKSVLLNIAENSFKRGLLMGEAADIVNAAVDGSGIDADRLAEIQRLQEEAKTSKVFDEFMNTLSFESFSKNPVGIFTELIVESFSALYRFGSTRMAAGAAVGAPLGPGGTAIGLTAGMGAASLGLEKSGVILEELQNRGYNTRSAEDIRKAFSDEKLMDELVKEGYKKGIPIAIFDMLSMGLAGKMISKPARTIGGRVLQGVGEVAVQSGLGGGGEIAGQLVQKGKVTDWAGVVAEAIAEIGTGAPEIAFGAITNKAKNNQQIERKDLVTTVSEMGIDKAFENVDVMVGSGSITAETGENIKQRLKETAEQVSKLPSTLSTDAKSTIVDLINERDRILTSSENLDDVFKKEANKAASNINDRIAAIAREDISSQEKQKEDATKESLGTKQEIVEQGGVSKYQGAEEVQEPATTETDISNRPVSGTQEVAFQKMEGPIAPSVIDGFFSPIEKRILDFKQTKASVQKWKDIVGIKSDESVFSGMSDWLNSKNPSEQLTREEVAQFINDNRIKSEIVKNFEGVRGEAQYQGYVLPGGDNYREILFTLPNLSTKFRSEHFENKNIAVHLRTNDRKDTSRNRVLFLEEIQSDWGQKGKKEGFSVDKLISEEKANEIEEKVNSIRTEWFNNNIPLKEGKDIRGSLQDYAKEKGLITDKDISDLRAFYDKDFNEDIRVKPSSAPYVTKTNSWVKMGLKIALQEAIATGKNRIAWTTGEQQNERYDLSKRVDELGYTYNPSNNTYRIIGGKNGEQLFNKEVSETSLISELGEGVANKIISEKDSSVGTMNFLRGQELKIGGKGMNAFYGDIKNPGIVANVAKALIKELTGKEGNIVDVQINTTAEEDITKRVFNETDVNTLAKYGFRFFRDGNELTQEAAIESVNSKKPVFARKEFTTSQPGIEITPELRDAILAGMPQFQKTINNQDNVAAIADEINNLDNTAVDFEMSDLGITAEANVDDLINRQGLALKPQVIEISDFKGIPVMVTISDELTTGAVINPVTGNIVPNLSGGIGFNYSEGNTGYAWAYTDEATANDTFNTAKEIYNRNPELYPDGIVPVAVVKMGTQAMNSNEAIFRVFIENISTLPAKNLQNAYKAYQKDVNDNIKRLEVIEKSGKLSPSTRNEINGYRYIRDTYLKENKNISDVIKNISQLNINTRPLVINRITAGEIGLIPADNRLKAGKPAAEALVKGLPKEDIKKIHLGHIGEILRDNAIKNVPDKHIISFVGIDVNAEGPVKIDTHLNYPYALRGRGLGVVKNTAHLASVMPTAYANSIKKVTDATLKGESVTKSQAVSRGLPSGLSNTIFRGKTLVEGMSNIEKLTGFLNLSFPKVTFFNDKQSFEDIMSSPNVKKYVRNGEIVYGLTTNGNIYVNPSIATMNTAIHEMGHIWTDFVENTNKPLFKKGIELVEGTKELEIAISQLGDNTSARKEALAMLIGNRGENITNAAQKSKFKEWLVGLWKYLQKKFPELRKLNVSQIGNLSLEQFLGGALRDILGGTIISEDPSTYTYQDVKKMSDLVPIGENLPSGPTGPTPPGEVGPVREGAGPVEKKKYEWEMGDRAEAAKGEQMIKTSTGRYVATETMRAQIMDSNKVLKEIEKAKESWFKKILNDTKVGMLDNQYRVLSLLESVGKAGQLVSSYLRTRNSASATANMMAEKAVKDIYGDISKKKKYQFGDQELTEYQLFNRVIGYQRAISIQNQMDQTYRDMLSAWESGNITEYNKNKQRLLDNGMIDNGGNYVGVDENGKFIDPTLETEFALGQVTATQAIKLLDEVRSVVGEEDFNKFMKLSESYSQYFNGMMKDRMEAGLISVDAYEYLSKFFYAPTRYINNILLDPILSIASPTTSNLRDKTLQLKKLAGGSERLNLNDYEGLLRATTYASEYSIAENRSTNRFFDLVQENKENFEKNGIRIGINYIPIESKQNIVEDSIDKNMKLISEGKKPSMDKALPSGQKMLPYKGVMVAPKLEVGQVRIMEPNVEVEVDEAGNKFRIVQIPLKAGEDYIKVYKDGRRVDLIVPAWFADAWYNRNMPSSTIWSFVGKVTGSNLLRMVATGINPVFGVAQLIPDTISAYVATAKERKYMPILIDYPKFFIKTLAAAKDIKNNSNDYIEANKYGATTNFYNGGMVTFERGLLGKEDKSLEKVIEEWNVPGLKQYIMGSKKITETTEQMSKVALYKEIRDSKIAAFTKENGLAPIGQDLEDIRIEAASASRATADFHRKGTVGSQLNMVIPYLNAAIQVQRAVIGSTKQNPLKVLGYTMEFASYGVLIMLAALGMGDEDDLKEKKRIAWSKLSDFDKDNRVPLYFVESKGKFVSVKLPQFVSPLWALVRRSTEKLYKGEGYDYSGAQFSKDARAVTIAAMEQFPLTQFINLEKVASRNPMYSGMSKMYNRDPYRQEEVVAYEKATIDYLEGAKTGERRSAQIYQMIGKGAVNPLLPEGISPKRLEAAMNTIPFENNPFSGVLIAATEMATSEKDLFEERFGKDALSVILKASGISQRYFKEGSKINQEIVDMPMEEVRERGVQREKIASMLVPRLEEKMNSMSADSAFIAVRKEFVQNEYKRLNPEEQKIAKSYIEDELKALSVSSKNKLDPMVNQIVKMTTSDAKINAMVKTMTEIKVSDESKMKFVGDMVESGIIKNDLSRRLNERGMRVGNNKQVNPYYEDNVGSLRDMILKYVELKKANKQY
jgi:hypothetical protein